MATTAWKVRYKKKQELVAKYADIRRKLKEEKNYAALAKLPREFVSDPACPSLRTHRPSPGSAYRKFKISRIMLRELAHRGIDPRHAEVELVTKTQD